MQMGDIKNGAGCLSSTCCVWVIPGRERAGGPRTQAARLRRQIGSPASSTKCFITSGAWVQGRRYGAESSGCLRVPVWWRRSRLFQNDGKSSPNCLKIYINFLYFKKNLRMVWSLPPSGNSAGSDWFVSFFSVVRDTMAFFLVGLGKWQPPRLCHCGCEFPFYI